MNLVVTHNDVFYFLFHVIPCKRTRNSGHRQIKTHYIHYRQQRRQELPRWEPFERSVVKSVRVAKMEGRMVCGYGYKWFKQQDVGDLK